MNDAEYAQRLKEARRRTPEQNRAIIHNPRSHHLAVAASEQALSEHANRNQNPDNQWWKKPINLIVVTITTGVIGLILKAVASNYFPQWFK